MNDLFAIDEAVISHHHDQLKAAMTRNDYGEACKVFNRVQAMHKRLSSLASQCHRATVHLAKNNHRGEQDPATQETLARVIGAVELGNLKLSEDEATAIEVVRLAFGLAEGAFIGTSPPALTETRGGGGRGERPLGLGIPEQAYVAGAVWIAWSNSDAGKKIAFKPKPGDNSVPKLSHAMLLVSVIEQHKGLRFIERCYGKRNGAAREVFKEACESLAENWLDNKEGI